MSSIDGWMDSAGLDDGIDYRAEFEWQAAQHADECGRRAEAVNVIVKAHDLGLAESECMAIAYEAGVAEEVHKELTK